MGTSVNQASPRVTNWNRVFACYSNENIPESRVINEIWRASENEKSPISDDIKSEATFSCYQAVRESRNLGEALLRINEKLIESGTNSIVTEFAKRAVPLAYMSKSPAENWKTFLFSELTNYVISRDASGFVGSRYRHKSVADLIEFKKNIGERVRGVVSSKKTDPKSLSEWQSFVNTVIKTLKG
ncbi:MAG: hypothetical protein ABIA11_01760 [Patescibacteria group bacterium]